MVFGVELQSPDIAANDIRQHDLTHTYLSVASILNSMADKLFRNREGIKWESKRTGANCIVYLGEGSGSRLEIVITKSDGKPTKKFLQTTYTDRRDGRVSPVLIVAQYGGGKVGLCGPSGEEPMVFRDINAGQAQRVCQAALDKPSGSSARSFLKDTIPQLSDDLAGLHNQGLLSTHELTEGVPQRDDWSEAAKRAQNALAENPRDLLEGLNYTIERDTDHSYVLKHTEDGRESAVAVFLEEEESFEHKQDRFVGDSPVAYALRQAEQRNLDYVIGSSGDQLRLYTTNPDAGFGSRGQTDTYVEVNTRLLDNEQAAYLWLLFSGDALQEDGSLHEIMEDSKEYATGLGERLRERIYDDVVPQLAEALAEARDLDDPDKDDLDETYRMTLVLLYRLLFIAYAEDERFLPRYRNSQYDKYSIKQKARDIDEGIEYDEHLTMLWDEVMKLTTAIHEGSSTMGLPAYDGRLLSDDEEWTEAGHQLSQVELSDAEFGPALEALLIDETPDGWEGPIDFRNVGVREFGVIYEGLLESELSVADQDLTTETDDGNEQYIPAEEGEEVVIKEGEVYLHGQSGERKATGTYYTKTRFVEHLLDYSLDPALEDHLDRVDRIREEDGDAAAADAFFDFRTVDLAMGSGHFLVGAVDRIEKAFRNYLQETTLTNIEEELDNLKYAAEAAFEDEEYTPDIERSQLLRRQIARRCIYGVDINDLATELARLSLWVHTFVPGLPLTFLDYNMRTGGSLAGIGTLDEVTEILDVEQASLSMFAGDGSVMNEIRDDLQELGQFADTSAEQVKAVRETRRELDKRLEPVRARFDILAASRIDDNIDTATASDTTIDDPTTLSTHKQAKEALASTNPLHFPSAFPEVFVEDGGFDVIVGNPPWEKTQIERHEFWGRYHPGLRGLSQRERESKMDELEQNRPDLKREFSRLKEIEEKRGEILTNGPYPGIGKSHPDLYKAFSWRFWDLVNKNGNVGVVLPRSCFIGPGMEQFRNEVLDEGEVIDLTFLKNKGGWVFEGVEPRYTVALFAFSRNRLSADPTIPIRGPYDNSESYETAMRSQSREFPAERAKKWGGSATIPLLPDTPKALDVFDTIEEHPLIGNKNSAWYPVPYQELNATQDKKADDGTRIMHMEEQKPDGYWPVYKGESFNIWDPEAGSVYAWADPDVLIDYMQSKREGSYRYAGSRSSFSDMSKEWVYDKDTLPCLTPRIAFRDIARRTDSRTAIASLVPSKTVLVHNSPTLIFPKGNRIDEAYFLGVLCSIPLDWYARRFVEAHVTFGIFNTIPVPRPGRDNRLRQRVVNLSGRLAAVDDRYADWADAVGVEYGPLDEETKQEKIYELDAVVAHLYGLTREHVEVIFETFHDGWNCEERLERVLDYYESWADRLDLDHSEKLDTELPEAEDDD
jgi:hypothetical protein